MAAACCTGVDAVLAFLEVDKDLEGEPVGDKSPVLVCWAVVSSEVLVAVVPASAFFDRSHPPAGYNDYTWYHLPAWNGSADLLRNADAIFAIFAARMARSSLEIRSRFK